MSSILSVIIVIVLAAMLIKIVEMVVDLEKTKVENGIKDENKGIISKISKKRDFGINPNPLLVVLVKFSLV